MSSEQQKEEIETILKEIYAKYYFRRETLYYKLKGEDLKIAMKFYLKSHTQFIDIVFNPNLEYALYINRIHDIEPSKECINDKRYYDVISQYFIDYVDLSEDTRSFISSVITWNDPLSQVFVYRQILLGQQLQHVYICLGLYYIEPYNPDPASIFHGKRGVVAYCSTITNIISMSHTEGIFNVDQEFYLIRSRAIDKLLGRRGVGRLHKRNPVKACDVNRIESIIHGVIEEADKLMKQYGIVRVAFPLE